jgi:HAD superfamily hydrolase (TIGR01450 family)
MTEPARVGAADLLERYEALLLDAYGVLMNETGPLPGAPEFVDRLNAAGKPYCVLTNDAAKLPHTTALRLQRMGLEVEEARIVTSGSLLPDHFRARGLDHKPCLVLGPPDSARYVELAGGRVVSVEDEFEVLVIGDESGFPFLDVMDATLTALFRKLDRGETVALVLPNPDLVYPAGLGAFGFASGTLAAMFENALALRYPDRTDLRFVRLGKPHAPIFEEGLRRVGTRRTAMIGDMLETDVRGANAMGIHSVLVGTGVSTPSWKRLPPELRPTAWLSSFSD